MGIFGENLRRHRQEREISNWFLERQTGIHRANLSAIERLGRSASKEVLLSLASVPELGLPYSKLRAWQILDKTTPEERGWVLSELLAMGTTVESDDAEQPDLDEFL